MYCLFNVICQVFPSDLSDIKYLDSKTNTWLGRSELDRRAKYINILEDGLPKSPNEEEHPLMTLVKQCLRDDHSKRPTSLELTEYFKDDMSYSGYIVNSAKQV